jgi:hypothetical protein
VVVCHSDLDLASGSGVHGRSAPSVVLTGAMTLDGSMWALRRRDDIEIEGLEGSLEMFGVVAAD